MADETTTSRDRPTGLSQRATRLPARLLDHPVCSRLARCMGVSVTTTVLSLSVLGFLTLATELPAASANVLATLAGIAPSYVLNRRWVWGHRDASDPWREIVPFCVLAVAGLVLSTAAVAWVATWAGGLGLTGLGRTAAILAANLSAFGALWLAQFVVMDRLLFGRRASRRRVSAEPSTLRGTR